MTAEAEIPQQWTHSLKLEDTAKGIRISVHVYANNVATAITEAIDLYTNARTVCDENKIPLAPTELKEK